MNICICVRKVLLCIRFSLARFANVRREERSGPIYRLGVNQDLRGGPRGERGKRELCNLVIRERCFFYLAGMYSNLIEDFQFEYTQI